MKLQPCLRSIVIIFSLIATQGIILQSMEEKELEIPQDLVKFEQTPLLFIPAELIYYLIPFLLAETPKDTVLNIESFLKTCKQINSSWSMTDTISLIKKSGISLLPNNRLNSSLSNAIAQSNYKIVEFYTNIGANFNAKDTFQKRPLEIAYDQLFFRYNLKERRKVNDTLALIKKYDEKSANFANNQSIYEYLKKICNRIGDTLLHIACITENIQLIDFCLNGPHLIGINRKNDFGNTPLHYAVLFNKPIAVRHLLAHNSNPFIKNKRGETALYIAQKHDYSFSEDILEQQKEWKRRQQPRRRQHHR